MYIISCINSLLGLRGRWGICTTEAQLKHWRVAVYTHPHQIGQTGDHRISHSNAENFFGGRPIEQQRDCLSLRLGELLLIAGGVEKSNKMFLSPAHYQGIHHSRHHHTHVSAQREGWPRYETTYTACLKKEEKSVREIVFYNSCF